MTESTVAGVVALVVSLLVLVGLYLGFRAFWRGMKEGLTGRVQPGTTVCPACGSINHVRASPGEAARFGFTFAAVRSCRDCRHIWEPPAPKVGRVLALLTGGAVTATSLFAGFRLVLLGPFDPDLSIGLLSLGASTGIGLVLFFGGLGERHASTAALCTMAAAAMVLLTWAGSRFVWAGRIQREFAPVVDALIDVPLVDGGPELTRLSGKAIVASRDAKEASTLLFRLRPDIRANRAAEVRSIIWLDCTSSIVGTYSGGGAAFRQSCRSSVSDVLLRHTVTGPTFTGSDPPPVARRRGNHAGSDPLPDALRWIERVARQ